MDELYLSGYLLFLGYIGYISTVTLKLHSEVKDKKSVECQTNSKTIRVRSLSI